MCNENKECSCIGDILKVINILQNKAERFEDENNACDRPKLGCNHFCECNTRPIQLITCGKNGDDPLVMPTSTNAVATTQGQQFSSVFRVEKVDDCCCTCRVLVPERSTAEIAGTCKPTDFKATNSFFTIDLRCVCAIRCLEDTFVDCI
jgi:spore coat protein Z